MVYHIFQRGKNYVHICYRTFNFLEKGMEYSYDLILVNGRMKIAIIRNSIVSGACDEVQ